MHRPDPNPTEVSAVADLIRPIEERFRASYALGMFLGLAMVSDHMADDAALVRRMREIAAGYRAINPVPTVEV